MVEITSFDYFYRHFLFQKNPQGYLEKKIRKSIVSIKGDVSFLKKCVYELYMGMERMERKENKGNGGS